MPSIDWLPWATPAFQLAQRTRRPVLLLLETAWSSPCRQFDDAALSASDVVEVVTRQFVAVRVDVDWRPDIADRYGAGAWPTLLALTPEGHVLGGGTPRSQPLLPWLQRAAALFAEGDGGWAPDEPAGATAPRQAPDTTTGPFDVWAELEAAVDPATGTFGDGDQPDLAPALAGLAGAAADLAPALAGPASATIDRLLASPRWDAQRGLLCCRGATAWEAGEAAARLDTQAEWVRLLAHAVECDARPGWHAALRQALAGLRAHHAAGEAVWAPWSGGPAITLVDATARACRALLAAARVLDEPEAAAAAIATLEAMLPRAYSRGAGVSHVLTTRPHGPALLLDAMLVAHALLDADPWRSQPVYRDLADELALSAFSRLAHPSGALMDRRSTMAGANAVGRLASPLCPLEGNAEAARLCMRLGPLDAEWQGRALQVLRGVHADVPGARGFAAPAALAWAAVLAPEHAISVW